MPNQGEPIRTSQVFSPSGPVIIDGDNDFVADTIDTVFEIKRFNLRL
jgi:hypothetical protein